ncbi:hypothetical protein PEBR_16365 [Penicillium brasilianum]|uniref:YjgF-like protein n=1 Tax=Penicillium brasilianum TaxID=104259 RepID=A0A1S9RQF1_PENBI|nr:hypothetical protein PEBR_16365 [Penicillium brasilianum]
MSFTKTAVATPNAPPAPPFLSQAIVMGDYVFCSGQIGCDPKTDNLVEGPIQERTKQILNNMRAVLEAAGTSLDNVVKCNIYLTSMNDYPGMNEVYSSFFKAPMPARTCVCVASLPLGTDVEIECIAGIPKPSSQL